MPSYEFHHRCPIHGWVSKSACRDSDYGIICGLCLDEGTKTKVRTRPKYTNSAGSFINDLKEKSSFMNKGGSDEGP